MSSVNLVQLFVAGVTVGAIYGMLGLGFVTIYRSSRVVNFAQGDFAMLGALSCVFFLKSLHLSYPVAAAVAVVATMVIGAIMYRLVVAPLGRANLLSMVMVTIGASMFLQNGAYLIWGPYPSDLPAFSGNVPISLGEIAIAPQSLWILLIAILVVVALYLLGNHTLLGKAMTATATDPDAASLVGISTGTMICLSFAVSASVGALAGLFLAPLVPLSYVSGGFLGLKGLVALTLGGWGMATGALVGGIVLGLVEIYGASVLPAYKDAIAFVVLIFILYLRPSGILNSTEAGGFRFD